MLIRVEGIPGSGKTTLKNELIKMGYNAYDTDDIKTEAFNEQYAYSQVINDAFWRDYDNKCKKIIDRIINEKKVVIILGFNPYFERFVNPNIKLAIKIPITDEYYRRKIKRDLLMLHKNHKAMLKLLDTTDVKNFTTVVKMKLGKSPSIDSFEEWQRKCSEYTKSIVNRGYTMMPYEAVLLTIKKL